MNKEKLREEEWLLKGDLLAISIVTNPAIEKPFKMFKDLELFKEENKKYNFKSESEKMELTGPVMIPNLRIPRRDENTKEVFNCWFSEETVIKSAETYLQSCNHTQANFEHIETSFTDKVFVKESWLVEDPNNDKSNALGFTDVVKNTWFATYKFTSIEYWNTCKELGFTGFSIEAFFDSFSKINDDKAKLKYMYNVINSDLSNKDKETILEKLLNK